MRRFWLIFVFLFMGSGSAHALAVDIQNINDFSLGNWSIGDPSPTAHIDVCVYAVLNSPDGGYAITASSPGGFFLTGPGSQTIPYSVYWDDGGAGHLGANGGAQLANNAKLTGQLNATTLSVLCALGVTGPTARLNLKITQADMTAALAGNYNGTINLLISPN